MSSSQVKETQHKYSTNDPGVRAQFGHELLKAEAYYKKYVDFVRANIPDKNANLLEIGCGSGWSTMMFKNAGLNVIGMDLHAGPLEAATVDSSLKYLQGDSQKIPFPDGQFDAVTMHDVLEHVPHPSLALEECFRVIKSGGRIIIVGPNLLSFLTNLYFTVIVSLQKIRTGQLFEKRTLQTPRHPGGNTISEAWFCTFHHLFYSLKKLLFEKQPRMLMREPDPNPPFFADNDACYYLNPMDLKNWANLKTNTNVLRWYSSHRSYARFLWPFLGGTWIVIEKI